MLILAWVVIVLNISLFGSVLFDEKKGVGEMVSTSIILMPSVILAIMVIGR